jgi:catechol 2,3-dioxygenase-like lactoylglutathione lyase family enzyme
MAVSDSDTDTLEPSSLAGVLSETDAVANLAVRDLKLARHFYEQTLGFEPVDREGDELIVYRSGKTVFNVYRSDYAGTNRATALTWAVGDRIEAVVETLKSKGIAFEHYDLPGMRREGDLHLAGGLKVAWFKDPDGNILNVVTG